MLGVGIGIGVNRFRAGGASFCDEYQAVYDSFTTKPSGSVASEQNTMVANWVSTGYWAERDQILVLAGHTNDDGESLINWKSPGTNDATIVGDVTFVAFEGFTSAGGYINTNFNPSSDGVKYLQDDASFGVYSRTDGQDVNVILGGNDGTSHIQLIPRYTNDRSYPRLNNTVDTSYFGNTSGLGMFYISRLNNTEYNCYHNNGITEIKPPNSNGVPNVNMFALASNNNGTPLTPSSYQLSFLDFGGGLTGPEVTSGIRIFDAYMKSNSKSVITDVPVFVLTGQSNAVGQPGSPVLSGLPSAYQIEQPNIKIFYEGDYLTFDTDNGTFVNMHPVENTRHPDYTDPESAGYTVAGWSVEQEISQSLLDIYPNVYVIKSAYGARTVNYWASPSGPRWVELNRYITNSLAYFTAQGLTPNFIGAVWMQGETDIVQETAQATYETALTTLISNLRGINAALTNLPFLMCEIPTDHFGDETICNTSFTNIATADANAYFIDTSAYAVGYDAPVAGHYIAQNLLDLGDDLYDAIIAL